MSTFEQLHPRETTGKFRTKAHSAPADALAPDAPPRTPPIRVDVLPETDPHGGFDAAVDAPTGTRYLREGKLHREDGPAYVGSDGTSEWYQDGELHREGGPAVVSDGASEWYDHGRLTRQDAA